MPYKGEFANKASHINFVKNPEVEEFLANCKLITEPSEEEIKKITNEFKTDITKSKELPEQIIAIDGSNYEANAKSRLPSTKVGYIKIGNLLIQVDQFKNLGSNRSFVDPFEVARLKQNNSSITITLPSANVILKGYHSVKDSFRAQLDKLLYQLRHEKNDPSTSLRTTIFFLASRQKRIGLSNELIIPRCPNEECNQKHIPVYDLPEQQYCPYCKAPIYPSDFLRIWEEVNEFQSNITPLSRTMQVLEHLIPIHYIRYLENDYLDVLSRMAFILDGPLAIFGPPAKLHASIMSYIYHVNQKLKSNGLNEILVMSFIKSGQIVDFVKLIQKEEITPGSLMTISDEFRYKFITPGRNIPKNGFGYEDYYGQDFIYKTPSSRIFVFNLVYPFDKKDEVNFKREKLNTKLYNNLSKALALIEEFECDLYENSVVPIALAHRYTAISLKPGGKVLDLLTKKNLK